MFYRAFHFQYERFIHKVDHIKNKCKSTLDDGTKKIEMIALILSD